MARGEKTSVYLPKNIVRLGKDMALSTGASASELIGGAVRNEAIAKYVKVKLSEGAYLCLAAGRFDLLRSIKLEDGLRIVIMDESAYRQKDGSDGEFKEQKDALMAYLSPDNSVELERWEYDQSPSGPAHLFYNDGSEVLVPRGTFDRAFGAIIHASKGAVMAEFCGKVCNPVPGAPPVYDPVMADRELDGKAGHFDSDDSGVR